MNYNDSQWPRHDSIYRRPYKDVEEDMKPIPPKNHPQQGQLFDDGYETERDRYRKQYENRKNEELAARWRELAALWEAVKDMDMEDAAEMIYDLVRETMERPTNES